MKRTASVMLASVVSASVESQGKRHKKDIVSTTTLSPAEWAEASVQRGFSANDKPFRVAIVGGPCSGKGTFINAIVGEKFMPSGGFRDTILSPIRVDVEHVKKFYGEDESACDCGAFDIFLVHTDGSATHCFCKSAEIACSYLKDCVPTKPLERAVVRTYIESCDGTANSIILSKFPTNHVGFSEKVAIDALEKEDFKSLVVITKYDDHMGGVSGFIKAAARRVPSLVASSTVYISKWDRASDDEIEQQHYLVEEAQSCINGAVCNSPAAKSSKGINVRYAGRKQYDEDLPEFQETFWESLPFEMEARAKKSEVKAEEESEDEGAITISSDSEKEEDDD